MPTNITTEILGDHPPLDLIATDLDLTTSWIRGGEGLIGFGEWKSTSVKGKNRFADARKWWHEQLATLKIQNNVHGSGTGPILFTSFAFDPSEESKLVIPKIVIGEKGGKSWITWIGGDTQPSITQYLQKMQTGDIEFGPGALTDDEWKNRVASAVTKIKNGDLEKVVLARDLIARNSQAIEPRNLIAFLAKNYPSTWVFLVSNLIGATPELLVRLNKSLVTSRILAGTIRKSGDEARDLGLAASLAKSSKDLEEHEYAVRSVADALSPYCSSTNVPESPFVLHLANVMHLATDVTGVLNDSAIPIDIFALIASLHPSAAVCGTPTQIANSIINDLEDMNRGRYAGPVGWIDARGDGEIGIALRTGELSEDLKSMRIFSGCGIVAGSNPQDELAESQAKLSPMRTALETRE
ncbi:MAG: isochorismate synthase [Actinobacteria bacterium]|uniref:isochorismate synthase n=1 Tax=freshwater metagenome TaxID=449393 RepID=A0A6J6P065_9ZZZZ|nr:isochorismate synthase [Actinomycetota bacterium]